MHSSHSHYLSILSTSFLFTPSVLAWRFLRDIVAMSSPSDSLDGPIEMHETKSDVHHDAPAGESIGHRPEDHDLSQFGYKAELEVCGYEIVFHVVY